MLAVHSHVDQDVGSGRGVQDVEEVPSVDADGERLDAVAVDDRRNPPVRADLAGHALARALAALGLQLLLHRSPPGCRRPKSGEGYKTKLWTIDCTE